MRAAGSDNTGGHHPAGLPARLRHLPVGELGRWLAYRCLCQQSGPSTLRLRCWLTTDPPHAPQYYPPQGLPLGCQGEVAALLPAVVSGWDAQQQAWVDSNCGSSFAAALAAKQAARTSSAWAGSGAAGMLALGAALLLGAPLLW